MDDLLEPTTPPLLDGIWKLLDANQRLLVIDAVSEFWSKGEPVPTSMYMVLSDAGVPVDQLQDFYLTGDDGEDNDSEE